MWPRSNYVEITTHHNVRGFLDSSQAYRDLICIPYTKLNKANQKIFDMLCDPVSFKELESAFQGIQREEAKGAGMLSLFVSSYFDENENFKYCLTQLKKHYEVSVQANEATPLLNK